MQRKSFFLIMLLVVFASFVASFVHAQSLAPSKVRLNTTAAGVELNWDDGGNDGNATTVKYEIGRGEVAGAYSTIFETSGHSFIDTTAVPGQTYYYAVREGYTGWDPPPAQVFRFEVRDSYGDGWNGSYIGVLNPSGSEIQQVTLSGGSFGNILVTSSAAGTYSFVWHSGSWDSECGFTIYDANDNQIYNVNSVSFSNGQLFFSSEAIINPPEDNSGTRFTAWSEEIVRFYPWAAATAEARNYKTETVVRARWPIYENEIVKTFVGLSTVPGEANVVDFIDVGHATEHTFSGLNLETGKEYFVTVKVQDTTGNLDGYGTSICSSRGFIFDYNRNLVDNASSTFFNNALVRVMTGANANFVDTVAFGNDAIRRYRVPIILTERGIESRFNAPVEVTIGGTGFPTTLTNAQNQVRVADEWGNEVPCNVTTAPSLTSIDQYLFQNGTQIVSFVPGYDTPGVNGSLAPGNPTVITGTTTNGAETAWVTDQPVDLTGWDEIRIDWSNTAGGNANGRESYFVVSNTKMGQYNQDPAATSVSHTATFGRTTEPINVSSLNGPYYIRVHARRGSRDSTVNVYNILLRKSPYSSTAVIIANLPKGGTRNYWAFWGAGDAAYAEFNPDRYDTSQRAWSQYYSRKLLPAGTENLTGYAQIIPTPASYRDDYSYAFTMPWSFPFFNQTWNNLYFGSNSYLTRSSYTTFHNYFTTFSGTNNPPGGMIAPMWCDTMSWYTYNGNQVPQNHGMYVLNTAIGEPDDRVVFYFRGNRYQRLDDIYIHQAVTYKYGDIALRYEYLSPGALFDDGLSTDEGLNDKENTCGISNNDGTNYFCTTPLIAGIGKNPTSFFQYKNAVSSTLGTTEDAKTVAGAGYGWAGRFESHVFDSRMSTPEWQSIVSTVADGGGKIYIYVRTGTTPEPGSGWSNWSLAVSNATGGPVTTPLTVAKQRYIQYRCEFFKNATTDAPVLDRIEFKCRGLEILSVTEAPLQVSQGQDNIPIKVTMKNYDPGSTASLTHLLPTFTLGNYTWSAPSPALPYKLGFSEEKEFTFNINVADDSPTGMASIDANATATIPATAMGSLFSDLDADVKDYWEVLRKAELSIAKIDTLPLTVTKGQTVTVWMTIDNIGGTPFTIATASLNIKPGSYTITIDPAVIGTEVAPGGTFAAKFSVKIELDSDSGVATLNGAATGTNVLSLKETGTSTAIIPDSWTVQNPPELVIQSVVASDTVYRGQTGIPVFLNIINIGEALAYWDSSKLWFTHGSYDDPPEVKTVFPIDVYGGLSRMAEYWVNVREDSATGTSDVDASIIYTDINSGDIYDNPLIRSIFPAAWLIIGEKIKVFKDSQMLFESDSFNLPAAGLSVDVYTKAFDLAYYKEYVVRWYHPDGSEYAVTVPPKTSDDIGAVSHQISIDSNPINMGTWRVKVTNPLNTHTACENVFQIVSPADPYIHISLPAKVSVGQTFNASATIINSGGAVLKNAYPGTLLPGGTGAASFVQVPDPTDKRNIDGNSAATFSYQLHADTAGAGFTLRGAGYGKDGNSDVPLTAATYTSDPCKIQTAPVLTVDSVTEAYTTVYRNQQNMTVSMWIKNSGEADAVVEAASLSFDAGMHYQVVNPPTTFPFILGGNGGTANIVFTVSIDKDSPTGVVNASCSYRAHDANNPSAVYGIRDKSFGWTISAVAGICSANSSFNPQQYSFNVGQTVNARFINLPLNTAFRIRFYNDSPTGGTLVKTSPPLNSGAFGVCDDQWLLAEVATTIRRRWRVVIDDGDSTTPGTQFGFQYFDVQNPGNLQAGLTLSPTDHVFVGETITATLVVNNSQTAGSTIGSVTPALLQKAGTATGNASKISGPVPIIASISPLMPGVFTWSYEATEDTTADSLKKFYLTTLLPDSASGFDLNTGIATSSLPATSNGIYIYRRGLDIGSLTIDFATALPGEEATPLYFKVINSGNYPLTNVKWFTADMRNQWTDYISKANLEFAPENFSVPVSGEIVVAGNLLIDHNQASGSYIATMSVYEDLNDNSYYDSSSEPGKLFSVKVEVPRTKSIVISNPFIDLDNWAPGQTAIIKKLHYFNGGNLELDNLKVVQTPPVGSGSFIMASPANHGRLGVASPAVSLDVSASVPPLQVPGIYIATFTIFDDEGPVGLDAGDTQTLFAVKIGVGIKSFTITPILLDAGIATPAHVLENLPALQFQINNTGGLGLTSLKSLPGNLKYLTNTIATENNMAIFLPANVAAWGNGPGSMSLYIPMGTPAGNYYLGKMWVYEDGNNSSSWDNGEASASFEVKATVPSYSAVQVIPSTVDLGDVAVNTGISKTFLCRNIGNATLTKLLWDKIPLLSPKDSIPATEYSFSGLGVDVPPGATFSREVTITKIPAGTDDGDYLGNMAWLFEDLDSSTSRTTTDPADPQSGFKVACHVGYISLLVDEPVGGIVTSGDPYSLSAPGNFSILNNGSLTLARPRATATALIYTPDPFKSIPASASSFVPASIDYVVAGDHSQTVSWKVQVPAGADAGEYTGTLTVWNDTFNYGVIDPGEAIDSAPLTLHVNAKRVIEVWPDPVLMPSTPKNTTITKTFEIRNRGNIPLDYLTGIPVNIRTPGGDQIPAASISFTIAAGTVVPNGSALATVTVVVGEVNPGNYVSSSTLPMQIFEDHDNPGFGFDSGIEAYDSFELRLTVGEKKFSITSPVTYAAAALPGQTVTSNSGTVTNGSTDINLTKLKWRAGNLVSGANTIASECVFFLPPPVAVAKGGSQPFTVRVDVLPWIPSAYVPPGTYIGTHTVWEDDYADGIQDPVKEASATFQTVIVASSVSKLNITTDPAGLGDVVQGGSSAPFAVTVENVGNVPLTTFVWGFTDLFKGADSIEGSTRLKNDPMPASLNPTENVTVNVWLENIPDTQPVGYYESSLANLTRLAASGFAEDTLSINCTVVAGGPPPAQVEKHSLFQAVAPEIFVAPVPPATDLYFLSAWVCPGSGSADLAFIQYDAVGVPVATVSLRVDKNGNISVSDPHPDFKVVESGISDVEPIEIELEDGGTESCRYYRVFMAFRLVYDLPDIGADSLKIVLHNSSPADHHAVWFDGIKLERAFEGQTRPTTYHPGATLHSPAKDNALSGGHHYYEW